MLAADGACANAVVLFASWLAGKMMIERDCAKEIGDRNAESFGYLAKHVLGKISIAVVKSVQDREQGSWLVEPSRYHFLIGRKRCLCHVGRFDRKALNTLYETLYLGLRTEAEARIWELSAEVDGRFLAEWTGLMLRAIHVNGAGGKVDFGVAG